MNEELAWVVQYQNQWTFVKYHLAPVEPGLFLVRQFVSFPAAMPAIRLNTLCQQIPTSENPLVTWSNNFNQFPIHPWIIDPSSIGAKQPSWDSLSTARDDLKWRNMGMAQNLLRIQSFNGKLKQIDSQFSASFSQPTLQSCKRFGVRL